jgi:amino acid adenylation domain-containing protein
MHKNVATSLERFEAARDYWLDKLAGPLPEVRLTPDFNGAGPYTPALYKQDLDEAESREIWQLAKHNNLSLYIFLLTVFKIVLHKYTGQQDIIVISPVYNVSPQEYNRFIALRDSLTPELSFKEFLLKVRQTVIDGYRNQFYPFDKLMPLLGLDSRGPLSGIVLRLEDIHRQDQADGLAGYHMVLGVSRGEGHLTFDLQYDAGVFGPDTAAQLVDRCRRVLRRVLDEVEVKIGDIELITPGERRQLVSEFNDTGAPCPCHETFSQLFEQQVRQTPRNRAVVARAQDSSPPVVLTYDRLNRQANQLAGLLRQRGIGANAITAIMVEPSAHMAVGILAVLKSGGAYLPLDRELPADRLEYMLQDSGCRLLLTQEPLLEKVRFDGEKIDIGGERLYHGEDRDPEPTGRPRDLFYMIYTSGTTGRPKGTLLCQQNLVNYLTWFAGTARLTAADKTLLTSSFAFDLGYTGFFGALLTGGELHLVTRETYINVEAFIFYIRDNGISFMKLTPSLFSIIVDSPDFSGENCSSLRLVVLGGEEINLEAVAKARHICPHLAVMNHYGPTETTIGSVARFIDFDRFEAYKRRPTIGKPIHNTRVYILDSHLKLSPPGIVGELYIGGDGVGSGYLNRPELTAERFVNAAAKIREETRSATHQPLNPKSQILYRTGDLARWRPDGDIEFLGRKDSQVKIRGFRVEPGEIENCLLSFAGIKEAVVMARARESGERQLYAYLVIPPSASPEPFSVVGLREYLSGRLPAYMIPAYFVQVEKIPLTPNGKLDRRALAAAAVPLDSGSTYEPPTNELEKKIIDIWKEVLSLDQIGIHDNFFELGGTSFHIIKINQRIKQHLRLDVPVIDMFRKTTVHSFADYVNGDTAELRDRAAAFERGRRDRLERLNRRRGIENE